MTNFTSSSPQLLSRSLEVVVLESLIGVVLTVSAIAGNILVFVAVYRNPQLRKMSNVYIVCLSLTDFFMGVLVFPIVVAALITGVFPGGRALCWFQAILAPFFLSTSLLTMLLIAVQRYYKIVRPNKYGNISTPRFVVWSIILTWSLSLVSTVLFSVTGRGDVHFYEQFPLCLADLNKITLYVGLYLICLVVPFFVMSLLYFKIWRFIRSHNAQMIHSNVNAEEVKLTKSLCIVLGAFIVCYTPFAITLSYLDAQLPRQIPFVAQALVALSSTVNPIIYGVMNGKFRNEFAKIICYPWKSRVTIDIQPAS